MALGDPFGTTAQLGYQGKSTIGQGVLSASESASQAMQKYQQQKQTQQMLQKMGIIKPDGNVNFDKASELGLNYNLGTGEATVKPDSFNKMMKEMLGQQKYDLNTQAEQDRKTKLLQDHINSLDKLDKDWKKNQFLGSFKKSPYEDTMKNLQQKLSTQFSSKDENISVTSKVERAQELRKQYPTLTKQQIIYMVNQEMSNE